MVSIGLEINAQETKGKENKNLIVFAFGYTFVPKGASAEGAEAKGVLVPSIGFDYFREISDKFEIGAMIDLELAEYLILEKNLNREKAFLVVAVGAYKLSSNMTLFLGGGIELEKHENLAIARLGADYNFKLGADWVLGPSFFYDLKKGYDTWSLSLGIGKEF
ncbi:MAG: hypothetical protein ACI9GM_000616 [Salibacteraceae bacterium]|jgi:hypothetical protein